MSERKGLWVESDGTRGHYVNHNNRRIFWTPKLRGEDRILRLIDHAERLLEVCKQADETLRRISVPSPSDHRDRVALLSDMCEVVRQIEPPADQPERPSEMDALHERLRHQNARINRLEESLGAVRKLAQQIGGAISLSNGIDTEGE